MKKVLSLLLPLFVLSLMLMSSRCKRDCDDDPTNKECACYGKKQAKALFSIKEAIGLDLQIRQETDTILIGNYAVFSALDTSADVYEWRIGTDMRVFTGRTVKLQFGTLGRIPITLKLKYIIPANCEFAADSVDIQTKDMVVVPRNNAQSMGIFQGYLLSNPNDTFSMTTGYDVMRSPMDYFDNLPKGCTQQWRSAIEMEFGYRMMIHEVDRQKEGPSGTPNFDCYAPYFVGYIDKNNSLSLDLIRNDGARAMFVRDKFIAKKTK